jgi:hypothetical protein
MAKVTEKRPDGSTVIVVPATEAADLEIGGEVDVRPVQRDLGDSLPWPFGSFAGELPKIEIADIKASRQEALLGKSE